MNTTTDLETPTPVEEIKQVDRPRYDVPIMIEITEEDRQMAGHYIDPGNCIAMTALRRNGFNPSVTVGMGKIRINGGIYYSDEISSSELYSREYELSRPYYEPEVVGKQIILYPV